jgi:hypothetical protein
MTKLNSSVSPPKVMQMFLDLKVDINVQDDAGVVSPGVGDCRDFLVGCQTPVMGTENRDWKLLVAAKADLTARDKRGEVKKDACRSQ